MLFFSFKYEPGCKTPHSVNYTVSACIILILSNDYIDYQHIKHAESILHSVNGYLYIVIYSIMGKTNADRQATWRERKKAQGGQESQDYWMKERKRDVDRRKAWSNTKRAKEAKASTQRKQTSRQRIAAVGKHPDVDK